MKAAVWHNNRDIRLENVPTPKPGAREMLVKVWSSGICGSDIVEWYRLPRAPLVQGHEIGGEVVEVGASVTNYKRGDRVFVAPKVPCMACTYCEQGHYPACSNVKARLPGGHAEYVLVPEALVEKGTYLLPATMTYDQATLIEPLACAVRAQNLAGVAAERIVLIMGCGMSGLLHVKLARTKHAKIVATDMNPARLDFAARVGADVTLDASSDVPGRLVAQFGRKADVVVLCTSAMPAIDHAWKCVDKGGTVVFFAVPGPEKSVVVPLNDFWTKEIRILTSYYCGPPDIKEALGLIEAGTIHVDDMITHRLPLADVVRGFQLVMDARESLKVILRPQE